MFIESASGGSARHALDLAIGLAKRHDDVAVAYSPRRANDEFLHRLNDSDLPSYRIDISREPGLGDVRATVELRKLLKRLGRVDIVHAHSSKAGAIARIATLGKPVGVVYTPHAWITMNTDLTRLKRSMYALAERALSLVTDRIVCVSRRERIHAISTIGIAVEKLSTIENGIDQTPRPARSHPGLRCELGMAEDDIVAGFVGRLCHQKRLDRLLAALKIVSKRVRGLHFVIVGDGPLLFDLRASACELGLHDRVRFVEASRADECFDIFDYFAMASLYEGFPYVMLDAASAGLPIVTTDVGGAWELVENGKTGFVCEDGDGLIERFAEAMVTLATDGKRRHAMGREIRRRAECFDLDRMIERTSDLYSECVLRRKDRW